MEDYEGIWGGSLIWQGFGHRAALCVSFSYFIQTHAANSNVHEGIVIWVGWASREIGRNAQGQFRTSVEVE